MVAEEQLEGFAACLPGVEPFLYQELTELELINSDTTPTPNSGEGGIPFLSSLEGFYRANLWLRTANRVLMRLGRFRAIQFAELRRKAAGLPWDRYLVPGQLISIRTTCHHSKLYHSGAVSERVLGAIGDRLNRLPEQQAFDDESPKAQLVLVRMDNDECTISLDTSGEPLHRRGYRLAVAKAPLRETLAAAMLLASGWDRTSTLLDPFCGSGVIPIEAAMLAAGAAPGFQRNFAFMDFPGFKAETWNALTREAAGAIRPPTGQILGSDRDAGAIKVAVENAERAGTAQWIQFSQAAISAIQPPAGSGWVVTNPPYGVRISSGNDLRSLYTQFGKVLRQHCPGWQAAYLCNDERLASLTRFEFTKGVSLSNGGIPVKLTRAIVQTGDA
ncbi:MAG TPA: class I SAM-dependent RNA methyltransferase [Bellilinea sp.]|nr:class I SAM-dependent RNA methyltransferase [Bellilinea sp.]